ncbi:MAG: 50S ribosomal protein L22 [bacterium]|nr:50S ribosomal protein L22 [bacterium]
MEAKASAKYVRIAPRKVRFVMELIRGKRVDDAINLLKFTPNMAAKAIEKVVQSAAANAEHNMAADREQLSVSRAFVDEGPTMKRFRPRAHGRANRIRKRTSHITVVVSDVH